MNKQEQIRQYLEQVFARLSEINPSLASERRRMQANDMFLNTEADFDIVKEKIDKTANQFVKDYYDAINHEQRYQQLRKQRPLINYDQKFEIKRIDSNGNTIVETVDINKIRILEGSKNPPTVVSFNDTIGYYKNSINTSTGQFDFFEYIICQLGKKLGISMAETYRLYQNGIDMGIISESVSKNGEFLYNANEINGLKNDNPSNFPIDINSLESLERKYGYLRNSNTLKTFVEEKTKTEHHYTVLENPEDIVKAVAVFPDMISCFQIPQEQKDKIVHDYYEMIMLDLITGNVDRNTKNYGFVQRVNGAIELAPLFDNSSIAIPHFPNNLTQINGYLMDRNKLLACLYEHHYDEIKNITTSVFMQREEMKEFLNSICTQELDPLEKQWLLDGSIQPHLDSICRMEDFHKIQELMGKTMDTYCTEFLEAKGLQSPLSEESIKVVYEQIGKCSSDREYVEIVNSYLQSFHQGHLYLKENPSDSKEQDKQAQVFPLIVRYEDGKYIVGASNQDNLEGQVITEINGIPIQEYVQNHTFANGDRAFSFDKDGNLYSPEFQINDDTCDLTMQDGTKQSIDKISKEQALKIIAQKQEFNKENVICGRLSNSEIPYICIQSFARDKAGKEYDRDVIKKFAETLNEEGQTDLIIDIRGNGGGSDEYFKYLGAFADKDYSQEHKYKKLVGLNEQEVNINISEKKTDDIDTVLERIEQNPNREIKSHKSTIPNGNSSITNRILLVDGEVFSSADKLAKTAQGSGFATLVGTELTAGDGKGVSTYSVDTPILRELGTSITMPSSIGLDFNEFQTTPDIIVSQHDLNDNLSQIMQQVKEKKHDLEKTENENQLSEQTQELKDRAETVLNQTQIEENVNVEWEETNAVQPEQIKETNNDVIINHVEVSPLTISNPSQEHSNGLGQAGQIGGSSNSAPSMSNNSGRAR